MNCLPSAIELDIEIDGSKMNAGDSLAPLYLTLHSLCDPREDKCDPALDLQCDPVAYACRYMSGDAAAAAAAAAEAAAAAAASVDTDGSKVPLNVVVGVGALLVLMLIVGVVFKCKSTSVDTTVDNGAAYVNPAYQHGNASPTCETALGNTDTSYDVAIGALAMVQGNSGGDPDHAAVANATYAGMEGAGTEANATYAGMEGNGTEESYAAVTGSTDDNRLSFANETYEC
jgi:hypothetical protein